MPGSCWEVVGKDVRRLSGRCLQCMEGVWKVSRGCLNNVWRVPVRTGQVGTKSGQVKLEQVKSGQVKLGQVKSGQVQAG